MVLPISIEILPLGLDKYVSGCEVELNFMTAEGRILVLSAYPILSAPSLRLTFG
jgi:hypothetical protein